MKPGRLKDILFIILFLIIGLVLDFFRRTYGIPITILDVLLLPLTLVFTVILFRDFYITQRNEKDRTGLKLSLKAVIGRIAIALLLFFPLGIWSTWAGIKSPFEYYGGVKGAVHGYTMIGIGIFVICLGIMFISSIIRNYTNKTDIH